MEMDGQSKKITQPRPGTIMAVMQQLFDHATLLDDDNNETISALLAQLRELHVTDQELQSYKEPLEQYSQSKNMPFTDIAAFIAAVTVKAQPVTEVSSELKLWHTLSGLVDKLSSQLNPR